MKDLFKLSMFEDTRKKRGRQKTEIQPYADEVDEKIVFL